jgi:hypothetical protein
MAAAGTAIMDGAVGDGVAGGVQVSISARVTMVMGTTLTLDTHTTAATDTIATGGTITTIATSRAFAEGRLVQGCAPRVCFCGNAIRSCASSARFSEERLP